MSTAYLFSLAAFCVRARYPLWLIVLLPASPARAELYFTRVMNVGQIVPDGGELANSSTLTLGAGVVTDVNIDLSLLAPPGGTAWAGDFYVALGHDTGYAVLANRIGSTSTDSFGSGANGLAVTLDDDAPAGDIHHAPYDAVSIAPPPLTGTWAPDARAADPAVVTDATPRTAPLASLNGTTTEGDWRLITADDSPGGIARLASWTLHLAFSPGTAPITLSINDTLTSLTPQILTGDMVNEGVVVGPSAPGAALTLSGHISGAGVFQGNFTLQGSYATDNRAAATSFTGETLFEAGHVLTMEIGGDTPGSGHDTLSAYGTLSFGGALNIVLLNGFVPAPEHRFRLFNASSIVGSFAQIHLPAGYVALGAFDSVDGFSLVAIPEPARLTIFAAISILALVALRRRHRRTNNIERKKSEPHRRLHARHARRGGDASREPVGTAGIARIE